MLEDQFENARVSLCYNTKSGAVRSTHDFTDKTDSQLSWRTSLVRSGSLLVAKILLMKVTVQYVHSLTVRY